ncbi:M56 family metallopeptidase [Janthinobacterium sp. GMG1]|uniref:M56 family metallopeptidase n=1 Tax=Janthinobacterium sp. GMG1 TaxID=3096007 RepID=UPI002ACAB54A|nr:M56 family metallopeptidase [Janthinobacterium sp. GMG1]MDZ5632043.1 M56 family metallopeptidase [Janthinobacterium sp. GMG1]
MAFALLLSAAAWRAERLLQRRGRTTRWLWLAVIAASAILPLAWLPGVLAAIPAEQAQLKLGWFVLSSGMLLLLALRSVWLLSHQRRWQKTSLLGTPVYLSGGIGPCVAGLLRPRIVMPVWLQLISPQQQALLLAHAQCRLAARDPLLLALAYALIILMPWNLPLWWQLHRLRFAIEVDCDARMLAQGHAPRDYAIVLRQHGQYYSGLTGASPIVLSDPRALRRRRHLMARFTRNRAANLL